MAFTIHEKPHHVRYNVEGVICKNCGDFAPGKQEWCLTCASNALQPVEAGSWGKGGAPHPAHVHHLEVDLSTGMEGYTRLTKEELKLKAKADTDYHSEQALLDRARQADHDLIRDRAKQDPFFAAIARRLGIHVES